MPTTADISWAFAATAAGWYALASIITFGAFALDKRRATARADGQGRIPEKTLHLLELLGGWPGALAAMWLIRHKNRKRRYYLVTWGVALLHAAGWVVAAWAW